MPSADPTLIVDALQRLLGRDPSADTLGADADGWVTWEQVVTATRVSVGAGVEQLSDAVTEYVKAADAQLLPDV